MPRPRGGPVPGCPPAYTAAASCGRGAEVQEPLVLCCRERNIVVGQKSATRCVWGNTYDLDYIPKGWASHERHGAGRSAWRSAEVERQEWACQPGGRGAAGHSFCPVSRHVERRMRQWTQTRCVNVYVSMCLCVCPTESLPPLPAIRVVACFSRFVNGVLCNIRRDYANILGY
jgi:hypothetical protein